MKLKKLLRVKSKQLVLLPKGLGLISSTHMAARDCVYNSISRFSPGLQEHQAHTWCTTLMQNTKTQ